MSAPRKEVLAEGSDPRRRNSEARKQAKAEGRTRYLSGIPCLRGHMSERLTSNGSCLACASITKSEKDKRYYERNAHKIIAYVRQWRSENIEYARAKDREKHYRKRDAELVRMRERYLANRDADCARKRKAWAENREAYLAAQRERYRRDNSVWKVGNRNRKARQRNAEGRHTADDITRIFKAQKGRCANCSKLVRRSYHVDHIVPLARGGSNWPSNLQIMCPPCNMNKKAADPIEFAQRNGRLL